MKSAVIPSSCSRSFLTSSWVSMKRSKKSWAR